MRCNTWNIIIKNDNTVRYWRVECFRIVGYPVNFFVDKNLLSSITNRYGSMLASPA